MRGFSAWLCGCTYLDNCHNKLGQARWQNAHEKKRVEHGGEVHGLELDCATLRANTAARRTPRCVMTSRPLAAALDANSAGRGELVAVERQAELEAESARAAERTQGQTRPERSTWRMRRLATSLLHTRFAGASK